MSLSNTYETKTLKFLFTPEGSGSGQNLATSLRPAGLFLALFTVAPTDTAAGTEVGTSNTAYARQAATFTVTGDKATNSGAIEYAECGTTNYGNVAAVGIMDHQTDAASTSNIIAYAALTGGAKTINSGDIFRIPDGDLDIILD